MKCKRSLVVAALVLANCCLAFAQAESSPATPIPVLHNSDVLRMHNDGIKAGVIISKIVKSDCNFDIFPPVLRDLKRRGVPDTVLMAMSMVPYGPPAATQGNTTTAILEIARVQIPAGTVVEVETASPVSSADVGEGSAMTFLVSRQVVVNGILVIDRGAMARAYVIKSKRAGAWGRGGSLDWVLVYVVAVDGTRVPIKLSDRLEGKNRSKAVVVAAIATGAMVLPYTPPVGLVWGLKKGDEAVLDESRKSTAIVSNNTEVAGLLPKAKKVIYHSVEKLKAADAEKGTGLTPFNDSFRATPIGRH
jgi:hypothetical protein